MGILDTLRGKMAHATSGGLLSGIGGSGGLLSGAGGSGGILSAHVGIAQGRLATAQSASGGPVGKIQAILSSPSAGLGAHLRAGAGLGLASSLGGGGGSQAGATATDAAYQVSSAARVYASPTSPPGIEYR